MLILILIGLTQITLCTSFENCWVNTNFMEGRRISDLASYENLIYASGGNAQNFSEAWVFKDKKWSTIYEGGKNSFIDSSVVVNKQFYVIGNSAITMKGWFYKYDPNTTAKVNLFIKNARNLNSIKSFNNLIYIGGITLDNIGYVWIYSIATGQYTTVTPTQLLNVSAISINKDGVLFVAGISKKTQQSVILRYMKNKWYNTKFSDSVEEVNDLTSDGNNEVYASGLDANFKAQIWHYTSFGSNHIKSHKRDSRKMKEQKTWKSMQLLGAKHIHAMRFDKYNNLYAIGMNNNFKATIWRHAEKVWQNVIFPTYNDIQSITINHANEIFISTLDTHNDSQILMCHTE